MRARVQILRIKRPAIKAFTIFMALALVFILTACSPELTSETPEQEPSAAAPQAEAPPPQTVPQQPDAETSEEEPPDFGNLSFVALDPQFEDDRTLIKDKRGYLQMIEDGFDRGHAADLILGIADILDKRGIPFVYVAMPPRFDIEDLPMAMERDFFGQRNDDLIETLIRGGVDVLDVKTELIAGGKPHLYPLKTDLHLETAGEFRSAMVLADKLESIGIKIKDKNVVFSEDSYRVESYKFSGWMSRYYKNQAKMGVDMFELWYPEFKTDLTLENPSSEIRKRGTFQNTVMNGMELNEVYAKDKSTNWVVNYMQWPSPYYTIENHTNEDGPNLLFLMDSYSMRTIAYFALAAGKITIIDPRSEGGVDYLNEAIFKGDYDAVIITAEVRDFYHSFKLEEDVR